jgi:flagellar motor switch protein FliG
LEECNKDAAGKICALMFTFGDLKSVDPSGIQTLMRSCEKDKTALALKRVSEELKDVFFSNMSKPAGKLLHESM